MSVLDYGTPETITWIRDHANELAAVPVEPLQSRHPANDSDSLRQSLERRVAWEQHSAYAEPEEGAPPSLLGSTASAMPLNASLTNSSTSVPPQPAMTTATTISSQP